MPLGSFQTLLSRVLGRRIAPNVVDRHLITERSVEQLRELNFRLSLGLLKQPSFNCLRLALLDAPALELIDVTHLNGVQDVVVLF